MGKEDGILILLATEEIQIKRITDFVHPSDKTNIK